MNRIALAVFALLPLILSCSITPTATPQLTTSATPPLISTPTPVSTATATSTAIPTQTSTATATREPTFAVAGLTPDQYPLAKLANKVIAQYAKATSVKPESVGLKAVQLIDYQAKPFKVIATEDGTPLLIQSEVGVWLETNLRLIYSRVGMKIGGTINGIQQFAIPQYKETARDNFDIYLSTSIFQNSLDNWKDVQARAAIDAANEANATLHFHQLFYRVDQDYLAKIPENQRLARMKERVKTIFGFIKKVDGVNQKQPTYLNIFNEPFGRYIDGRGRDIAGWKVESLALQTLGDNVLIETYMMCYEEAKAQGLEIEKDVFFYINEYGLNTNNPKKDFALRELRRAKAEIAKRLNVPIEQVKLGLGLQQRYDETNPYDMPHDHDYPGQVATGRVRPPTEQELETTTSEFQKVVDWVFFTEVSDLPATSEQRQARFETVIKVAKRLGIRGVIFENPLRFHNLEPQITWESARLFNPQYEKTAEYFILLKTAYTLLAQGK